MESGGVADVFSRASRPDGKSDRRSQQLGQLGLQAMKFQGRSEGMLPVIANHLSTTICNRFVPSELSSPGHPGSKGF